MREKLRPALTAVVGNQWFCLAWIIFGCTYFTWYGFLKNPNDFTASMIGLDYPWLFRLWGQISTVSIALGSFYAFKKYSYTHKAARICLLIAWICITICTIIPSTEIFSLQLVAHWSMALSFGVFNALAIGLCLLSQAKTNRLFLVMLILFISLCAAMIALLIAFGKSGTIENIPLWGAYLVLFILNVYPKKKSTEPQQKAAAQPKEPAMK